MSSPKRKTRKNILKKTVSICKFVVLLWQLTGGVTTQPNNTRAIVVGGNLILLLFRLNEVCMSPCQLLY